jgi:DNA-binding transcriptional LysR family regulator
LALAGHGIVLAPNFTVGSDIAEGRLTALLTGWSSRTFPIHALRPLLSTKVRSIVDFLSERFGSNSKWEH